MYMYIYIDTHTHTHTHTHFINGQEFTLEFLCSLPLKTISLILSLLHRNSI